MKHELKILSEYFDAVCEGTKTFEIRKNDRDFKVGDELILKEWKEHLNQYSGWSISVKVDYILNGGKFGIEEGFVIMSISKV